MKSSLNTYALLFTVALPLALSGCQSTTTNHVPPNPHYTAMAKTVAELRQAPCHAPVTTKEQKRLAQFDLMVIVGGALHAWVPPHEFPIYLQAMKDTLDCNSEQWVSKFKDTLAHSPEFAQSLAVLDSF